MQIYIIILIYKDSLSSDSTKCRLKILEKNVFLGHSVSKVLAIQSEEPEFNPHCALKKPGRDGDRLNLEAKWPASLLYLLISRSGRGNCLRIHGRGLLRNNTQGYFLASKHKCTFAHSYPYMPSTQAFTHMKPHKHFCLLLSSKTQHYNQWFKVDDRIHIDSMKIL